MLKLYVWENVLCDYTPGFIAVVAKSAKDARALIKKQYGKDSAVAHEVKARPQCVRSRKAFVIHGGG